MDARRFDRWTRLFAATSRRDTLKWLAAGLAAPLAAASTLGPAAARCGKKGDRCRDNNECCDNFRCRNDKCKPRDKGGKCGKDGHDCRDNSDCCGDFHCKNDRCRLREKDRCGKQGDDCRDNGDCCHNFRCKNERCITRR